MLRSPTTMAWRPVGTAAVGEPGFHLVKELQLVGEFLVDCRIGLIAACRDIEIVYVECRQSRPPMWRQSSLPQKARVVQSFSGRRETMATP